MSSGNGIQTEQTEYLNISKYHTSEIESRFSQVVKREQHDPSQRHCADCGGGGRRRCQLSEAVLASKANDVSISLVSQVLSRMGDPQGRSSSAGESTTYLHNINTYFAYKTDFTIQRSGFLLRGMYNVLST